MKLTGNSAEDICNILKGNGVNVQPIDMEDERGRELVDLVIDYGAHYTTRITYPRKSAREMIGGWINAQLSVYEQDAKCENARRYLDESVIWFTSLLTNDVTFAVRIKDIHAMHTFPHQVGKSVAERQIEALEEFNRNAKKSLGEGEEWKGEE